MPSKLIPFALILAALAPQAASSGPAKRVAVKLQVETSQEPTPAAPGAETRVSVTVGPPKGVSLNRYPGIRLKIEEAPGLKAKDREAFVGSDEPVPDPDQAYFGESETLSLRVIPERRGGTMRTIRARLTYFYCVKESGYCAPGKQTVEIPVEVSSR